MVAVAASVCTAFVAGGVGGYAMATRPHSPIGSVQLGAYRDADAPRRSLPQVAEAVRASVVTVRSAGRGESALGSGVVVSTDGYILTNDHVVPGHGGVIAVTLPDGRVAIGRFVGADVDSDLAIIKVNEPGLVPAELGDSDTARPGDPVLAVGS